MFREGKTQILEKPREENGRRPMGEIGYKLDTIYHKTSVDTQKDDINARYQHHRKLNKAEYTRYSLKYICLLIP